MEIASISRFIIPFYLYILLLPNINILQTYAFIQLHFNY